MTTTALAPRAPTMATAALEDPERLGTLLAASGFFPDTRDAAQAVVKVLAGAELGIPPIASMTGVNIIKGRVALSAFLMAFLVKRHPKYDFKRLEFSNTKAAIEFFENGKSAGISEFTIEDARTAGLAGSDNWRKYPANMLFWRAMTNGAKMLCPDAFAGAPVYTPDELGADVDPETGDMMDAAPSPARAPEPAPAASAPPPPAPTSPGEDASAMARASAAPLTEAGGTTNGKGAASTPAPAEESSTSAPSAEPSHDAAPDPDAPVTDAEVEAFFAMVKAHGIPENVWRVATLAADVEKVADLPREAFDALVRRASAKAAT